MGTAMGDSNEWHTVRRSHRLELTRHARERMAERSISLAEVQETVAQGRRCRASNNCLKLIPNSRVVITDADMTKVVTTYRI